MSAVCRNAAAKNICSIDFITNDDVSLNSFLNLLRSMPQNDIDLANMGSTRFRILITHTAG